MSEMIYVAFGSNVGNGREMLADALRELSRRGLEIRRTARLYVSSPAEGVGGGEFLNTVFELACALSPRDLLTAMQQVEQSLGSPVNKQGSARACDLDLLLYGELRLSEPDLTIPHARLTQRDFVLRPLCDLIPNECLPGTTETFASLLERCSSRFVLKIVEREDE